MGRTLMRRIVRIDEEKCDGCGQCIPSCAEGAIEVADGKARLVAENLCDGLGNCLGVCPKDAITIEERPADAFDDFAVGAHKRAAAHELTEGAGDSACGCPGAMLRKLDRPSDPTAERPGAPVSSAAQPSRLEHWPVQLKLLPERGALWDGADVLIAADCAAYAMGDFHRRLLAGRTLAIVCPKLDDAEADAQKLARIFADNNVRSVTMARMEVPCCGLDRIVRGAMARTGKSVPLNVVTISTTGETLDTEAVSPAG